MMKLLIAIIIMGFVLIGFVFFGAWISFCMWLSVKKDYPAGLTFGLAYGLPIAILCGVAFYLQ